jgi:enoyl-CoA hydratase/carnithine racemase
MPADHKIEVKREARDGGVVAHVIYDYARRLNVLNPASLKELTETFLALAREDDLRVVVFSGAGGRAFIGGADINHMAAMRHPDDGRTFITMIHKLCQSIRDCPVPVICRLEGYTLGAGVEVAAACDIRIAADTAHFGMPEVKVGVPSVVEAALLPRLIGWAHRPEHRRRHRRSLGLRRAGRAGGQALRGGRALCGIDRRGHAQIRARPEAADAALGAAVDRRGGASGYRRLRPVGRRRRAHRAHGGVREP